jgi:hypothetical protein
MKATILKALFIAPFVGWVGCLWVPEGTWELGRLPQAAPSLSRSALSQSSVSQPFGFQSTIAKESR